MAQATGVLSKGITLSKKVLTVLTPFENLMEVPELGGKIDKAEVTTLADSAKRYIRGLKDYGDLEFKFLYDNSTATSNYRVIKALEISGAITEFVITFPDTTTFTFSGSVMCSIDSAKVSDALTFSMSVTLNTDIVVGNPTV